MISTTVSRASALLLFLCGIALLFAPDVLLPALVAGFPPAAAWLGQLLGAAWLGVAALNWLLRNTVVGGIYGRPIVIANAVLYFVSAASLLPVLAHGAAPASVWVVFLVATVLAIAYGALLFRGPFDALHSPAS